MVKKKAKNSRSKARGLYVLVALILFNILLILDIWLTLIGAIIALIAGAFAVIVSGLATLIVSLIYTVGAPSAWISQYISFGGVSPVAGIFISIALICFGALWMIGNYYIVKYFYRLSVWYGKLNVDVFREYGR